MIQIFLVDPHTFIPDANLHGLSYLLRGDFHPLGRFINQIERSSSVIRINSMRIHRKEYTPEHVVTDLSIAYFQKVVESL